MFVVISSVIEQVAAVTNNDCWALLRFSPCKPQFCEETTLLFIHKHKRVAIRALTTRCHQLYFGIKMNLFDFCCM